MRKVERRERETILLSKDLIKNMLLVLQPQLFGNLNKSQDTSTQPDKEVERIKEQSIEREQYMRKYTATQYRGSHTIPGQPHNIGAATQYRGSHTISGQPHNIMTATQYRGSHTIPGQPHNIGAATQYRGSHTIPGQPHNTGDLQVQAPHNTTQITRFR